MGIFTEKSTVENYIIEKLKEKGWKHVPGEELEREDYSEPLLVRHLLEAIHRINPHLTLTKKDLDRILLELRSLPSTFDGSKRLLKFLKEGIPIELEKTGELRYVSLLDYENPKEKNEFIVSDQVPFHGPKERCRLDIVLYVNGIPLVAIECKNPTDPTRDWETAYKQIKSYEKAVPELFKYVQFSIAAAATTRYFPNVLGAEDVKIYFPKGKDTPESLDRTLDLLLNPDALLDLVANFIFAREEHGKFTKVLPYYYQYEGANQIYQRVLNNLSGKEEKEKGLIWHWQGSGKTLTMIYAARKLYLCPLLENPTIFFVVDREELEEQLFKEFSFLDLGIPSPEVISSIEHLRQILTYDEGRGKRGMFITLIHKFGEKLADLVFEDKDMKNISNRRNVIVLIDEGHRTQYGEYAGRMRGILKKAFFFAFTGTPFSTKKRDTFAAFAYPEEGELYLHKYFVRESIEDGFTLPIVFQTRMEKEVGLEKELLEEFLEQELEEITEESLRLALEGKISRRLTQIVVFFENPERIEKIASDIATHFKENVDGKFKGMVVAASRKACIYYKEALDRLLGPEYSEIVMTFNPRTDPEPIKSYYEKLRQKYHGKEIEEIWDEIIEKFKEREYPKILIVTDKLLTGFDAPILQVMYLDKPLKEHRLLQAIARTNRPFKELKPAGLIIDYVGILKEFEKAVAIYEKQDIQYVGFKPEEKIDELRKLISDAEEILEGVDKTKTDFETLKAAAKLLFHYPEKQRKFSQTYKQARNLYEFLLPFGLDKKTVERFKWLAAVYNFHRQWVEQEKSEEMEENFRKFYPRVVERVHKAIQIEMKEEFPSLTLDKEYLERLGRLGLEDQVYNMVFGLNKYIRVDRPFSPIYEPIAKRVEKLVERWRNKKISVEEAYNEAISILQETRKTEERIKTLGFSEPEYFILKVLEKELGESEDLVQEVRSLWRKWEKTGKIFPGWTRKMSILKELVRDIRMFMVKKGIPLKRREELCEEIINGLKATS